MASGVKSSLVFILVLFVAFLTSSDSFRLSSQPNLRQEEGEENESGNVAVPEATTKPSHLIGTLAGVLSSILRSGPNGTSPIKFNLTETLQRLTRFQIKLPTLPSFFGPRQKETPDGPETIPKLEKIGKKRLIYRNPGSKTNYGIHLLSEIQPITSARPIQSAQEEDYDDGVPKTPAVTPGTVNRPLLPYVPPSTFPIYPVASTTEDLQEAAPSHGNSQGKLRVPAAAPSSETERTTEDSTIYPVYPTYTTDYDIKKFDIGGMAGWISLYLNPALKLAKDSTRNLTVSGVVNGTAEGVLTGVEGVKKGVQSIVTAIPKLTEVITGLIDFFEDIE